MYTAPSYTCQDTMHHIYIYMYISLTYRIDEVISIITSSHTHTHTHVYELERLTGSKSPNKC